MRKWILIIGLYGFYTHASVAQGTDHGYEVGSLRFEGNREISYDQLMNVIRTRETPWVVWKWIYNRFNKEILGGQKPEYFDPVTFASDNRQVKRFYADNGFFHAKVDTSIIVSADKQNVQLTFSIAEGRRSIIDTILYQGLENLSPEVREELSSNKQVTVGTPYIRTKVEAEYKRVVGLCANNGYVNMKLVSVDAQRYASTDNISLVFVFDLGKRFTFGTISVEQDTTTQQFIDSTVVLEHLDFSVGQYYSEEKKIESERNLNRLGVFEATKIENAIPKGSSELTQIPVRVIVRTRSFHELTPEIGINDENSALNFLLGIGYNHRNFFGGARNLSTNLRLSVQSLKFRKIFKNNLLRDSSLISKVEWTIQFVQPYFINNKTSISAAFSAMLDKQSTYYIPSLNFRLGTQSQTATYTRLFIDWNLQLSDPKTVATQQYSSAFFDSLGFEKQFNSFITTTLQRDKRNDIFYPSEGFVHSISVEEGGFVPRVFGGVLGVNLPYSQYVKLMLSGQWYWNPDNQQNLIWALRLRAGSALLYGISPLKDIPIPQRFYSGGSESVRGWQARYLGPPGDTLRNLGGDALLEGTMEARLNPLKDAGAILEKISFVLFYDVGNMWRVPKKIRLNETAMAFGFGLRYNTIAGPIRIDFGMKLYDPDTRQWVTQKNFFPETFSKGVIHFGVGHTF